MNLADEHETRIKPETGPPPAQRLALSGRLFGAAPWVGLAALAAVLIAFEWLSYHFRWTE